MSNQMKIKVVSVEVGNGTTKTGKDYKFLEVFYKNLSFDNKAENKKIMPFGSKEVFSTLEKAQAGSVYTLIREKDKDGYWQWVGIAEGDVHIDTGNAQQATVKAAGAAPATSPKSTYETPEERAKKQVYIVRQSSLATAVEYLIGTGAIKKATAGDVIFCAQEFENYVFGIDKPQKAEPLPALEEDDDVPM